MFQTCMCISICISAIVYSLAYVCRHFNRLCYFCIIDPRSNA